jgi:hypothetical protein
MTCHEATLQIAHARQQARPADVMAHLRSWIGE